MPKMNFKPTERDIEVGQKIHGICVSISDALTDGADASDAKKAAGNLETTGRLGVILQIAELSSSENWSETEINRGCDYAANVSANDGRIAKSLQNFCSDMRNVAHPKVRDQVPDIHAACTLAWQAETNALEGDKEAPRPLREFAKRQYHLVLRAIKEQRIGKETFTSPQDVIAWAENNAPAQNAEITAKALEKIAEQLHAIYDNFPDADIKQAADSLGTITAKSLRNLTTPLPQAPQKPVQAAKPVRAVPPPAKPLAAVQQAKTQPVEAVVDAVAGLDEFLNDAKAELMAEAAD